MLKWLVWAGAVAGVLWYNLWAAALAVFVVSLALEVVAPHAFGCLYKTCGDDKSWKKTLQRVVLVGTFFCGTAAVAGGYYHRELYYAQQGEQMVSTDPTLPPAKDFGTTDSFTGVVHPKFAGRQLVSATAACLRHVPGAACLEVSQRAVSSVVRFLAGVRCASARFLRFAHTRYAMLLAACSGPVLYSPARVCSWVLGCGVSLKAEYCSQPRCCDRDCADAAQQRSLLRAQPARVPRLGKRVPCAGRHRTEAHRDIPGHRRRHPKLYRHVGGSRAELARRPRAVAVRRRQAAGQHSRVP